MNEPKDVTTEELVKEYIENWKSRKTLRSEILRRPGEMSLKEIQELQQSVITLELLSEDLLKENRILKEKVDKLEKELIWQERYKAP